ncbi:mechanosensitive ion channel [Synechococcus sp. RedBA-s]|nr:mechanosensitive ion channel [Synechococcus sp. RedBA-s]
MMALGMSLATVLASPLPLHAQKELTPPKPAATKAHCIDPPQSVTIDGRRVLEIRSTIGAQDPVKIARQTTHELGRLAASPAFQPEGLAVEDAPPYTFLVLRRADGGSDRLMAVDDRVAACFDLSRQVLAEQYRSRLVSAVTAYRRSRTPIAWVKGTALALLVLVIYLFWIRIQSKLNRRAAQWIAFDQSRQLQGLRVGSNQLLESVQIRQILQLVRRVIHWSLLLLISYLLVPLLLGLFPPTQGIADGLRQQILQVIRNALALAVGALPNLVSILLIAAVTVMAIRASNAWFSALERGRVRIPGFYQEWALPTARLATIFIALIGLVLAYPYIPGSGSKAFQGAGLFVGALAALGSSAIATNIISGLMLIYTRAFRLGDRVDINGTVGVVQERALLVTRVRTPRNELVSIPNAIVIGASVVNFSFSRREIQQPVAIATTITIGYDVPWRRVHELMLAAAKSVKGVSDEMAPYVIQTSLNDFHISYELNAFVIGADTYRETLSDVLAALQDHFAAAKVEILSPGYHAIRNGNASTLPKV